MNANKNNKETQEESIKNFLEYHIGKLIQELQEKLKDKEKIKEIQDEIENKQNIVENFSNTFSTINAIKQHKVLQEIQIILGNTGKYLSFINYTLELYATDDRMTFYAKIGSDVISDLSFAEILATSQKIANYLINKIKLIPKGGHPLIIAIGGAVGFFVSEEVGDITEYFINGIADFIAYDIIYVDTLFEKELLKNVEFSLMLKGDFAQAKKQIDFTHAFLGLTKGKSPDELDKIKLERDVKYWDDSLGKMVTFRKETYKWYETMDTNEFNDGFWGFGTGTDSVFDVAGKVFENNQ